MDEGRSTVVGELDDDAGVERDLRRPAAVTGPQVDVVGPAVSGATQDAVSTGWRAPASGYENVFANNVPLGNCHASATVVSIGAGTNASRSLSLPLDHSGQLGANANHGDGAGSPQARPSSASVAGSSWVGSSNTDGWRLSPQAASAMQLRARARARAGQSSVSTARNQCALRVRPRQRAAVAARVEVAVGTDDPRRRADEVPAASSETTAPCSSSWIARIQPAAKSPTSMWSNSRPA